MRPAPQVRRRTGGRSARVVSDVLEATLRLVAQRGPAALSFAAVADLAGVSRTTVYRRWPTKRALVRAALLRVAQRQQPVHDTGTLRGDLGALVRLRLSGACRESAVAEALARAGESGDPELLAIVRLARGSIEQPALRAVVRAIARGELPPGTDPMLVAIPIVATLQQRSGEGELALAERVIDVVLAGVRVGAAVRRGAGG